MTIARGSGSPSHAKATHGNTATIDSTGTNLIVEFARSSAAPSAPTEDKGNGAPTGLTQRVNGSDPYVRMWYWLNPTVGSSHGFSAGDTNTYGLEVSCYSGVATSSAFDKETTSNNNNDTLINATGADSTNNDSLFLYGFGATTAGTTPSETVASFNTVDTHDFSAGVTYLGGLFDRIESGNAGTLTPRIVWTNSSNNIISELAIFAPATGGGGLLGPLIAGGALVHGSLIRGGRLAA